PGGFPSSLWDKYLEHFDKIVAIGRCSNTAEKATNVHVQSSCENVEFTFVDKISSPISLIRNFRNVKMKIQNAVIDSDYVIARLPSENGLLAISLAKKFNKPFCIEVVGCAWDGLFNYGNLIGKIYAPIAYYRMKKAVKSSCFVLYVTNEFLQNRYPSNKRSTIVSASNVSINVSKNDMPNTKFYKYAESKRKLVFGLIGNFKTKYKGIHIAIEALSKVQFGKENLDFEFRVLGKGDPEQYNKQALSLGVDKKICFYEPLPSGLPVHRWLDDIDIYIQPSLQEGLPRALIEAMSRGCVAIGSTTGGIPELLEQEYIHKSGSVEGLVRNIEYVISNSKKLTDNSRRNFEESLKYDSRAISSKRSEFFKQFADETRYEKY
ncbi:glycosyltransferase family 4 protein, partial [Vibrio lentus]